MAGFFRKLFARVSETFSAENIKQVATNVSETLAPENIKAGVKSAVEGVTAFADSAKNILEEIPMYNQAFGSAAYEQVDQSLRREMADRLMSYKELSQQAEQIFVRKNLLAHIGKTEPVQQLLDKLTLALRSSSLALVGIGSGFKPTEDQTNELMQVDAALTKLVADIKERLIALRDVAMKTPEDIEGKVFEIVQDLELIEESFKERTTIFNERK